MGTQIWNIYEIGAVPGNLAYGFSPSHFSFLLVAHGSQSPGELCVDPEK